MPRLTPYTRIGIRRRPCDRCGGKGFTQWSICADDVGDRTQYRVLCVECDISMNEVAMRFVFGVSREAELAAYRRKMENA